MAFSLNGWQVPPPVKRTYKVPGANRRLTLDATAGPILTAVAADYHKTVRPIDVGVTDEGGFNDRDANGAPGRKSNHASGTAVDLNWSKEGAGWSAEARTFWASAKAKLAIARIKLRYRKVVQWGGDWHGGVPGGAWDPMHFEIKPGVSRAAADAERKRLKIDRAGVRS